MTSNSRSRLAVTRPPDRADVLKRIAWLSVQTTLYRFAPVPFHPFRAMLLRAFGATIEGKVYPYPTARVWAPWNLTMRSGSTLGPGVECYNVAPVMLGEGATVSQRAFLCTASHDYDDPSMPLVTAPIHVGRSAWIAAEAFVAPGVVVGEGAVALARAVVTRDVSAWSVVAGNPATQVRTRKPRHD